MSNPHGRYTIEREERTIFIRVMGAWNLEGYRDFVAAFKQEALALREQPWGVIVDIREWELSTPEVEAEEDELQLWTLHNNQRWRAFVSDASYIKALKIEEGAKPVEEGIESRFFSSHKDARQWFASLGLLSK